MLCSKKRKPGNVGISKGAKFSSILVDTNKKILQVLDSSRNIRLDKAKTEDQILFYYFVIKTIDLVWNTFLSLLCV